MVVHALFFVFLFFPAGLFPVGKRRSMNPPIQSKNITHEDSNLMLQRLKTKHFTRTQAPSSKFRKIIIRELAP